jgi:hypothetical protein
MECDFGLLGQWTFNLTLWPASNGVSYNKLASKQVNLLIRLIVLLNVVTFVISWHLIDRLTTTNITWSSQIFPARPTCWCIPAKPVGLA